MLKRFLPVALSGLILFAATTPAKAQVSSDDIRFARLFARSRLMPFQEKGGDDKPILALITEADKANAVELVAAYRAYSRAMAMMSGTEWTPEAELDTALDFSLNAKVVGAEDYLQAHATFLFDAPAADAAPYRMELEIISHDGNREVSVPPGIQLGDVRGRKMGETVGLTFQPSKLVGPGFHVLRATLRNGRGALRYRYYRSFVLVHDLTGRMSAAQRELELLPDGNNPAAATARYLLEETERARRSYSGGNLQRLAGYIQTFFSGDGSQPVPDFDGALKRAAAYTAALKKGGDPLAEATGDLRLAYRSSYDGKLVPYRIYIPSNYQPSKPYPIVLALHGAGGDENSFFEGYQGVWPKLAEERGYILAAINGRGPVGGYAKENGSEQDLLDVMTLVSKHYRVDSTRVYLAGHSLGGFGTWKLGLEHRDRFAALASIAGTRVKPEAESASRSGLKIPIAVACGVKDALVPVVGCRQAAESVKGLGYPIKYLEYPQADHSSVAVVSAAEIFNWFDAHRKAAP